jgi:lipase chaperone LimK
MKQSAFHKLLLCSATVLCACVGIGGAYLLQAATAEPSVEAEQQAPSPASAAAPTTVVLAPRMPVPEAAVRSAEGKSRFSVDPKGNLLVDDKTEAVLDGFLAALPPDATAVQRQDLETRVRVGLPEEAAARALQLMRAYIEYRKAYAQLPEPEDAEDVAQQRQAADVRIALRRKYFDKDSAAAMFGAREARQIYSLEVARIALDSTLGAEAKAQSIKSLHAALPPRIAAMEFNRSAEFSAEVEERVAFLRLRGAPEEEVRHARYQYFGIEKSAQTESN